MTLMLTYGGDDGGALTHREVGVGQAKPGIDVVQVFLRELGFCTSSKSTSTLLPCTTFIMFLVGVVSITGNPDSRRGQQLHEEL